MFLLQCIKNWCGVFNCQLSIALYFDSLMFYIVSKLTFTSWSWSIVLIF